MASGVRRPSTVPRQAPEVPRRFDATDPEKQGEIAPRGSDAEEAARAVERRPRHVPEANDEGSTRRR